jgi:integrase
MSERAAKHFFTDAWIRGLKPATKLYKRSEHAPKGEGRLVVRVLPSGLKEFFLRYRTKSGDTLLALGRYGDGRTLADIRKAAGKLRRLHHETGDVKAHLAAEQRRMEIARKQGTFQQLLDCYVDWLRAAGKPSAAQAEGCFRRNVLIAFPAEARRKANEIEVGDIRRILARMVKAGIKRQVNIMRAYLRAAFEHAIKADNDPRTLARDGVLFGLKYNPVASVPCIAEFDRVGERTLTAPELREFWRALDALPPVQRATLRSALALAAQRPTQLLRAGWGAFDFQENTLLLYDTKGRCGAREHLLPLTSFAIEQLRPLRELNADAPSPFTADGRRPMVLETLSAAVAHVSAILAKSHGIPKFQLRDLRRTVETMLQKLRVEKEVRAHLLSHGRTQGVQGKHYERYDFLREKRQALELWASHLDRIISGQASTVVSIRAEKGTPNSAEAAEKVVIAA